MSMDACTLVFIPVDLEERDRTGERLEPKTYWWSGDPVIDASQRTASGPTRTATLTRSAYSSASREAAQSSSAEPKTSVSKTASSSGDLSREELRLWQYAYCAEIRHAEHVRVEQVQTCGIQLC